MITPYVAADLPHLDLRVVNVTTVRPERTFWDKLMILHGLRQWHERRGELRRGGQRVSRHHYDVQQLLQSEQAAGWIANRPLAQDCARHARLFFGNPDLGLETARHGTFTLTPTTDMHDALRRDYDAMTGMTGMTGMIFHGIPSLDEVLASVALIETAINI